MSKAISSVSRVVNQQALEAITQKLTHNVWATPCRSSPNAEKLKDGAIQRISVTPNRHLPQVSQNPNKIGLYKRGELNERASQSANLFSFVNDYHPNRDRVARIYFSQRKHVHCHPVNKNIGKHWILDFSPDSTYKSPTMFWTSATTDTFAKHTMKFPSVSAAVSYCEKMGMGYDVLYPQTRYHTKKSYADNFQWKGNPKDEQSYD